MSFSNTSTVPIELLPGIGKRTAKILRSLDIRTIGEFKSTPEKVLVEIFGPSIRALHNYVNSKRTQATTTTNQTPTSRYQNSASKNLHRSWGQKLKVAATVLSLI